MSLMTVKDLTIGYDQTALVKNLNFCVGEGNYLCIVGENGTGKSTLMKTLLGLIKPISGDIIRGDGLKVNEIGYLPQQTDVQRDFPASVTEVVMSGFAGGAKLRPFYSRAERERARENMERMGIAELRRRCYRELSGGQQQRVLLARALCATSRLLLLDEPVSGLDPKVTEDMYKLIADLNHEGTAIIMISHDVNEALNYATHVLHMGHSVFYGTKAEYMKEENGFMAKGGVINA
ncbi:MAG: metal ABC transporter ATP-binding protein [Lachnospiraceae bacterium]|nr:metal ABC transporter ATP-binding protein [Lachnospiraceae bacterium]